MSHSLTELEKKVISVIQGDIAVTAQPYLQIAQRLDIPESELLAVLKSLRERGIIRRFGATLRHQKSGYAANAMVAWQVAENRIEEVGHLMAGFKEVSHCYRRDPTEDWPYNLYTMVHAADENECIDTTRRMARKTGVATYSLLFSRRELKKTSMKYFSKPKN